jgi:hypothetical protein
MAENIRTYLVGRRNSTVACDIALPESEKSVSRKHLELTVTASGQCYIVHTHPENTTKVRGGDGNWLPVSQDYVDFDTPIMLGNYQTTARQLLALLQQSSPHAPDSPPSAASGERLEWDPERGTFLRR